MARVKLSEYDAKRLLFPDQIVFAADTSTKSGEINEFFSRGNPRGCPSLVVKVDQGIKKRGKQGLVKINVDATVAVAQIRKWSDLGFSHFLIEPVMTHEKTEEQFLSLERTRIGWKTLYSKHGGIDIEDNWDTISTKLPPIIHNSVFKILLPLLDQYHLTNLELNPFILKDDQIIALDAACEIDDAALGLSELSEFGISEVEKLQTIDSEHKIALLNASTPASLKFKLVNPEGRIWVFLSGGGASLVIADEVADLGLGADLANYGEYSGAPTDDDVYSYTKIILTQLLTTNHQLPTTTKRAIIIAGGVANFTDVAKTFKGLIRALGEKQKELVKAGVKVYVRRGGPNEKKGLQMMEEFLHKSGLYGSVHGHDVPLTEVVSEVKNYLIKTTNH